MQSWLFKSDATFWTTDRVEAFLGGVTVDSDMLILDLFAESEPQWQRTTHTSANLRFGVNSTTMDITWVFTVRL
jgi:hypothetical protein